MPARRKVTHRQMEILLAFMEEHKNLAKGRISNQSGPLGKQGNNQVWDILSSRLNSQGDGATKSSKEWKTYWNNLKYKVRAKASQRRRHMSGTGGGPAWNRGDLSDEEWQIINILGQKSILGEDSVRIPFDEIDFNPEPSTSTTSDSQQLHLRPTSQQVHLSQTLPVSNENQEREKTPEPPISETLAEELELPLNAETHTERLPRPYVRRPHQPDVPDWAREMEERHLLAEERMAQAMESLLENQQQILNLLKERLPTVLFENP